MITNTFIDNAKVMSDGQITIPKDIREVPGVSNGDTVTFIVDNGEVRLVNTAVYAINKFHNEMKGEAEKAGLKTEDEILSLVKEIRSEGICMESVF